MFKRAVSLAAAAGLLAGALVLTALPLSGQATGTPASAASSTPAPNPFVNISYPPPVYVVRGEFDIRGTANLPLLSNYFIEFRPLEGDLLSANGQAIFFPAILPSTTTVQDDVLGTWDTSLVPDGIYELRLTVNVTGVAPQTALVSPIRVENNPPPFAQLALPTAAVAPATAVPQPTAVPVTPTTDPAPIGTITPATANVRTGDGQNYPIIGSLARGTSVQLIGLSNRGSNWYQVRIPSGQLGWMAASVLSISGNVATLPLVAPPPPPPTAIPPTLTPTPIPLTPTPSTSADYTAGNASLNPASPQCNQQFIVSLDIANLGTATLPGGFLQVTDTRALDNSLPTSVTVAFPVINPNQTINVQVPLTISTFFNENHRITLVIDPSNILPESNEGNNVRTIDYLLVQGGSC